MATSYRTPGVYIEEKAGLAKPIEGVGTSTAAFEGVAPNPDARVGEPVPITNWSQFRREFVDDEQGRPLGSSTHLSDAVFGFFQNGGRLVHVLNTGEPRSESLSGQDLHALRPLDVQIVAAPGRYDPLSHNALLEHCENLKTCMAVLDGPRESDDLHALTVVGQAELPSGEAGQRGEGGGARDEAAGHGGEEAEGAAGGGGGSPPGRGQVDEEPSGYRPRDSERGHGAFYVPWVVIQDPLGEGTRYSPPSGAVAGVWARTDAERGVHAAPANAVLRGAVNLQRRITDAEQADLNFNNVNVIRYFPDRGNLVWGARTVASDPEWRYVPVRRLLTFLEQSILRSTQWAVFQPNGPTLWKTLRLSVTAFLTRVWRDGALFGTTPQEAFMVQCDEETNSPEMRDAGIVVTRVGVAPMKPAEFVVFEVSQYQANADRVEQGASGG